jgi:hypothetical protein
MTPARTAGLFLLLAVAAGMAWCWAEFGSPMIYFLLPLLPLIHLIAAVVLVALTRLGARRLPVTLTIWLPPVIVYALIVAALNGFFLPAIRTGWLLESLALTALTVGLPGALCATWSHLRHRRGASRRTMSALADSAGLA